MSCKLTPAECAKHCQYTDDNKASCPHHITETPETSQAPKDNHASEQPADKTSEEKTTEKLPFPYCGNKFSADNQPDRSLKSEGWRKKKFSRDTIREMMNIPFTPKKTSKLWKDMVEIYGEDYLQGLTWGQAMTLKQQQVAIENGSTQAFVALSDQSMGRPVQAIAQTDVSGNDLPPISIMPPPGFKMGMPSNIEGNDSNKTDDTATE